MLRTEHSECEDSSTPQAREACAAIRASILAEEARLRAAHPLLAHQDALALGTWALCLLVMAGTSAAYLRGQLPWYIPFFSNALAASFLHELEHDLIHSLYFVSQPLVTHAMFALIWVAKLSLNPWTRRSYHLHHHRRSGQVDDVEERLLGLGAGNLGFLRLAVALVPALASILYFSDIDAAVAASPRTRSLFSPSQRYRGSYCSGERWLQRVENIMIISPLIALLVLLVPASAPSARAAASAFLVLWGGPNVLRHACLSLMSSFSHFYGDVVPGDVLQQNQILNHPALWPLQLFCANFGAEHIIHHFVTPQPFWVRHAVRHAAWDAMVAHGVRVNDWGAILSRAQRYGQPLGQEGKKAA